MKIFNTVLILTLYILFIGKIVMTVINGDGFPVVPFLYKTVYSFLLQIDICMCQCQGLLRQASGYKGTQKELNIGSCYHVD